MKSVEEVDKAHPRRTILFQRVTYASLFEKKEVLDQCVLLALTMEQKYGLTVRNCKQYGEVWKGAMLDTTRRDKKRGPLGKRVDLGKKSDGSF